MRGDANQTVLNEKKELFNYYEIYHIIRFSFITTRAKTYGTKGTEEVHIFNYRSQETATWLFVNFWPA